MLECVHETTDSASCDLCPPIGFFDALGRANGREEREGGEGNEDIMLTSGK